MIYTKTISSPRVTTVKKTKINNKKGCGIPHPFFINTLNNKHAHYEYTQRNFTLHLATPSKPVGINYVTFYETLCFKRKV